MQGYLYMEEMLKEKMNPGFPFGMKYIHPDFRIGCDEFTISRNEEEHRTIHVVDHFIWLRVNCAGKGADIDCGTGCGSCAISGQYAFRNDHRQ